LRGKFYLTIQSSPAVTACERSYLIQRLAIAAMTSVYFLKVIVNLIKTGLHWILEFRKRDRSRLWIYENQFLVSNFERRNFK
jgi:hypothetical protein